MNPLLKSYNSHFFLIRSDLPGSIYHRNKPWWQKVPFYDIESVSFLC